jgi:membrane-associated protease RseP (regulator of RpoE activity)
LFVTTLITATYAGIGLVGRDVAYAEGGWTAMLRDGLAYSLSFLLFLTAHEFGHYFAARARRVAVSLPYFIPVPFALGTFGAVIRIREPLRRTTALFDIGAAGPLVGFVVALGLVAVGLLTLPGPEYLLSVSGHETVVETFVASGRWPGVLENLLPGQIATVFGDTLLFGALSSLHPNMPPAYELQHYPLLLAGWLGLFFTALNLLPVGQLDGGHVVYALLGPRAHAVAARGTSAFLLTSGALGGGTDVPLLSTELGIALGSQFASAPEALHAWARAGALAGWPLLALILYVCLIRFFSGRRPQAALASVLLTATSALVLAGAPAVAARIGYSGWLIWGALLLFFIRLDHPPVLYHEPLTPARRVAGWMCVALLVLCFSPKPLEAIGMETNAIPLEQLEQPAPAHVLARAVIEGEGGAARATLHPSTGMEGAGRPGRAADH